LKRGDASAIRFIITDALILFPPSRKRAIESGVHAN
jgi:hypothetical protein